MAAAPQPFEDLVATLERLSEKTRRYGLLSLAPELPSIGDATLRRALQLVQEGIPPSVILDTLRTEISAASEHGGRNEAEHDRLCFIALGTIALQQGYPPRVLRKLAAGFGADV